MSSKFLMIVFFITLLLDWAALDDITTGKEPSFLGEYLILIISIPVLIFTGYQIYRIRNSRHLLKS